MTTIEIKAQIFDLLVQQEQLNKQITFIEEQKKQLIVKLQESIGNDNTTVLETK